MTEQSVYSKTKCVMAITMRSVFQEYVFKRSTALGLSRTELARRANISRESLYKLLRGEISNPGISTMHALAIALNVAPIYLLRKYFDELSLGPGTFLPVTNAEDHSSFVRDVTIPDGIAVGVNQMFTKTWELQNTGSHYWRGRRLVCQDDDHVMAKRMPDGSLMEVADCHLRPVSRKIPMEKVAPGDVIQLSMDFVAPSWPCVAMSLWKMADAKGTLCFPEFSGLWVKVRVVAL